MEQITVAITVNDSGAGTGYGVVPQGVNRGLIHAIRYVKGDYADGVDVAITGETSGIPILSVTDMNASATYFPRAATCDTIAAASLLRWAVNPLKTVFLLPTRGLEL